MTAARLGDKPQATAMPQGAGVTGGEAAGFDFDQKFSTILR